MNEASRHLEVVRKHAAVLWAIMPGLMVSGLHSSMLAVPKADFVDALDSDHYRIQWLTGAYILGTATGMGLTRFAGARLGLRLAFLLGLLLFTLAGSACGLVNEVIAMAPFRLVQGVGNGLVISVGMVLIWRHIPDDKSVAMSLYGMAIYLPALAGAVLGGFLTAVVSWQLIFLILLPLGATAMLFARRLPPDEVETQPPPFDWIGLGLLQSTIVTLSVVLDMGQYWGWINSPRFVPWLAMLCVCVLGFLLWGTFAANPLTNLRVLAKPNFALGVGMKALFSINLYVIVALLASDMIALRGYQWQQASLVIAPAVATMFGGLLAGALIGTPGNRRLRLAAGFLVMTLATFAFTRLDLYTAKALQAVLMAVWGAGAGLVIAPAMLTAFEGLSADETLRTAGVFNILRTVPVFIVSATLASLLAQKTDAQFDVLRQTIRYNRPIVEDAYRQPASRFTERGSAASVAGRQAHAMLGRWVHANARAFALQGIFGMLAIVPAMGLVLVAMVRVHSEGRRAAPSPPGTPGGEGWGEGGSRPDQGH